MPLLEQIVRMQAPRKPISTIGVLVWSGQLERAGKAPSLLDWNRQGVTSYGHSQLHRAVMQGMPSRGLGIQV